MFQRTSRYPRAGPALQLRNALWWWQTCADVWGMRRCQHGLWGWVPWQPQTPQDVGSEWIRYAEESLRKRGWFLFSSDFWSCIGTLVICCRTNGPTDLLLAIVHPRCSATCTVEAGYVCQDGTEMVRDNCHPKCGWLRLLNMFWLCA